MRVLRTTYGGAFGEHQNDSFPGFCRKYRVHRLVYLEVFQYVGNAIRREKEVKGWLRKKKVALIERENPTWEDLSAGWFELIRAELFIGRK
jgi:putative endonuclease